MIARRAGCSVRTDLRMRDAQRVAAAAGVGQNLPLIIVGDAAVGDVLVVAGQIWTIVVHGQRRLRAAFDIEVRVARTTRHRDLELRLARRDGDLVVGEAAGGAGETGHGLVVGQRGHATAATTAAA